MKGWLLAVGKRKEKGDFLVPHLSEQFGLQSQSWRKNPNCGFIIGIDKLSKDISGIFCYAYGPQERDLDKWKLKLFN